MSFTPYVFDCLRTLQEENDAPTDALLVHITRVQLIRNNATPLVKINPTTISGITNQSGISEDFHAQTLVLQLEELKLLVPEPIKSNGKFKSSHPSQTVSDTLQVIFQHHLLDTTVSLYEHSLLTVPITTASFDITPQLKQAENLYSCLVATKAWYDTFLSLDKLPLSSYPQLPLATFAQCLHCMTVLYRLSTFEAQGVHWDRQMVLNEINLGDTMDVWCKRLEAVPLIGDPSKSDTTLTPSMHFSKTIAVIVKWWKMKVEPGLRGNISQSDTTVADEHVEANGSNSLDGLFSQSFMNFPFGNNDVYDEIWMRDLFAGTIET
jgi:hypothetical protein